jgi:hypothetical protein
MPNTITLSNGVTLTRDSFVAHYMAACLGSWAADSDRVDHPYLPAWGFVQPTEKAARCATEAWNQLESENS